MDQITMTAASGMRARSESLDMLANNLSNASTPGYKADREFYNLYRSAEADAGPGMPLIERNWTDFSQGTLTETHQPLDLALDGKGFFVADAPSGPLFTRQGAFRLSKDGVLETRDGYRVRAAGDPKFIRLRSDNVSSVEIRPNGEVAQEGQVVGRVAVVDFEETEQLEKQGHSYFRLTDQKTTPGLSIATVHQGNLEASNVTPAESSVRLISVMRQFEMLQKVITLGAEMNKKAVEEVARVS